MSLASLCVIALHCETLLTVTNFVNGILVSKTFLKSSVSYILTLVINLYLWHFMFQKRKVIRKLLTRLPAINPSKKKGFILFKVQFWIDALIISSFTNPIISIILIKDVEGETLVKIAAVYFGNEVTRWMNEAGVLKAIFRINYFCVCFFTNALMNLFTGLSCYFFHNFREAISGCTKSLCQGTENIEKMYQIYMSVLMLADAVENEFGHLFLSDC
ncbi:hypothetical protein CEXT_528211 [Caerostris extrusa]|uniref:Uncharacterized protein n=1 Tax=Caerostris extrusa TaxID=172846 RepID=A0AAV4XAA9_CAEEX|nr:hypothetical protein CEXT_528211 [Caerostris extrusa]